MLKSGEFTDRDKGIRRFLEIINSQITTLNARLEEDIEQESRRTWYLDTSQYALYNNNNFLLRIREEPDEYDITLKCRHPDRYMSAPYDLSSPVKKLKEIKFEEDITSPFSSKFSLSAKYEEKQMPDLNSFQKLQTIFPAINSLGIPANEDLKKVNEFEAREFSYKIGKILFPDGNKLKTEINFWYLSDEQQNALIIEFTFDYKAKDVVGSNQTLLEEFPLSLIRNADELYLSLQKENIIDLDTSKTKTEYAYQYKRQ
jgi:hypothetical protein